MFDDCSSFESYHCRELARNATSGLSRVGGLQATVGATLDTNVLGECFKPKRREFQFSVEEDTSSLVWIVE